jgi:hypothetical protein
MKRMVLVNKTGEILATADYPTDATAPKPTGGSESILHRYTPLRGQAVHVVDFPDEASTLEEILAFHRTHVVRVVKGTAV